MKPSRHYNHEWTMKRDAIGHKKIAINSDSEYRRNKAHSLSSQCVEKNRQSKKVQPNELRATVRARTFQLFAYSWL